MSQRSGWRVAAVLALMGCALPSPAPRQVAVLGGEIHVRAPQFYCVDQASARSAEDTAVVLIGRCTENGHVAAALLTVTVGRAASGGVLLAGADALAKYLTSTAGRRALSRSGHDEDVQVLETGILSGQLMLHIKDTVAGEYWRAIIGIKGRLVTVSASGAQDAPLTSQAGRKLVSQTVAALIKANPTTVR